MCAIVEHGWYFAWSLAESVVLDDDESDTSHGEVLLGAAIDALIFADVNRTTHDVR